MRLSRSLQFTFACRALKDANSSKKDVLCLLQEDAQNHRKDGNRSEISQRNSLIHSPRKRILYY